MRFTLLTQVALLTLSVAIIFLFIKPALADIKAVQDDLLVYSDAVAKAAEYNKRLQELLSLRDSFSQTDLAKLERFIPSTIDTTATMYEIENIFASKNIKLTSLIAKEKAAPVSTVYTEGEVVPQNTTTAAETQDFEVKFDGDYDALKSILGVLEANARLLEVVTVSYGVAPAVDEEEAERRVTAAAADEDQSFTIVLRAYSLQAPAIESQTP